MAYTYGKRRENPPTKTTGTKGFSLGPNQLTHPSIIKNNELVEALNVVYSQNGVLKKRLGSTVVGEARTYVDEGYYVGEATQVTGLQAVYNIGDSENDYVIRVDNTGIAQTFNHVTGEFTDIPDSPVFDENYRTYILQGYGIVYFMNQGMILAAWDGTDWTEYTALADPETAPTLAKQGSGTGPRTYYYAYAFFNDVGYTIISPSESLASMPETLDTDTWIKVTIPTPPAGTVAIGIFRGTTAGTERFLDKIPVSQLEYHDKGEIGVDLSYPTPLVNTTGGMKFKIATVFKSSLVGITEELGDDTIVYSGSGENFGKFGSGEDPNDGGVDSGFFAWRKGDGAKIVSLQPFKEQLYVFKTNKTGVFDFIAAADGAAVVRDINLAVGAVSQDAIHPAGNDLRGFGQEGAFSMGNEPNFADVIRTKVLSARMQKTVDSLTFASQDKIVSVYHKNLSIWALSTRGADYGNNIMLVYDERYVAWSVWRGMSAACFTKFIDENNVEHLYYGDADSGNMVEMFNGYSDQGAPIIFKVSTKHFDANLPYKYKTYGIGYFIFGLVSGQDTVISVVEDAGKRTQQYRLTGAEVLQGMGIDEWGTIQWGDSSSDEVSESESLVVKYIDLGSRDLFSVQAQFLNTGLTDQIEVMGVFFEYSESEQPLPSSKKLQKITS